MIYHPDSSICKAAIHAGVLTDQGGQVEIVIMWQMDKLYGSENQIESSLYDRHVSTTFVVGKPNSIALKLSEQFE